MMKCPECQTELPEGMKFCGQCGHALEIVCAHCKCINPPHFRFCGSCGQPLVATSSIQQQEAPVSEGERKHITVLFSDLSGYTSLSEKLDPEEVKGIINRIFGQITKVVSHHEGTIEKFIGDAVVAFFGIPRVHEDDPVRAIRTAFEIHEIVRNISPEFEEKIGRSLAMHTGINTGLVVTGKLSPEEEALQVAGDSVNVASRLSGLAKPGEILVGEDTYQQAQEYFSFEKREPAKLKGKADHITPYRVVEEKNKFSHIRGLAIQRISSPLVGRDAEFVAMKGCVNRLLDGQGGILSIIGEAGLGKSRLMAELRNSTITGNNSLQWLEGHTLSYGQKISYWPFREIVRHYAGITDDDSDTESWKKLKAHITELFTTETEEILPYIASLATLDIKDEYVSRVRNLDGEGMGRQIFFASRQFFERLAQVRPLVLVFEDLHWADESSTLLLEHLLPLVHRVPILLCGVSRPEANTPTFRLKDIASKGYERRYTEIRLDPLSQTESIQLMHNLLEIENLLTKVREIIVHKAEGNPFFMEEIMRSLIDGGAVVRDIRTGRWRATSLIERVSIPDTIQGVIMARVDRLDEELKQVLRSASVIGRAFLYRILIGISEAVQKLDVNLDQLEGMELIRQKQKIPELEYIFKHALVQETTYESILLQKRRELHVRIAQVIENLFPERLEEFYSVLAHHYVKGEVWDKAQDYLFKAGDQAGRIAADSEALEHYEQALKAYTRVFGDKWDALQRASLERKMAEAFLRRGEHDKAIEYLQRALSYVSKPLPLSPREMGIVTMGEIVKQMCHLLIPGWFVKTFDEPVSPMVEEVVRIYEVAVCIAPFSNPKLFLPAGLRMVNFSERNGFPHGVAIGYAVLVLTACFLSLFRIGGYYARKSVALAELTQHPGSLGFSYQGMGAHEMMTGRISSGIESCLRSADDLRKGGYWNPRPWGTSLRLAANGYYRQGNFAEALKHAQELIKFGEDSNDYQNWCWGLALAGMAQRGLGRLDEAGRDLEKAKELAAKVPDHTCSVQAGAFLADCFLLRGDFERSLSLLKQFELIGQRHNVPGNICIYVFNKQAHVYVLSVEQNTGSARIEWMKKAKTGCKRALKISKKFPTIHTEALRHQGTYQWLVGKPTSAQKWWEQSLNVAEKIGMRFELGLTHLEMGRRLKEGGHLEQAEKIFIEIGAEFDLAETRMLLQA